MKWLVCCMIIIANISNNGKASIDSFVPASTNILFEDTTINSDKSCYRPCKFNVKPRKCYYYFNVEPKIQEDGKPVIAINGVTPGPPINICINDVVVVEVRNKVPGQNIAVHWHGVDHKSTPFMDGVPMVTQCPIGYGSTYKYAFIASAPGTFFYHSDSVSQQSDGVYGSLIVSQPQPLEPHSSLYDYDKSKENTLLLAARFPELLTGNLGDLSQIRPSNLFINGYEDSFKLFVIPGFTYRLRLINAIAVECPVVMSIDHHELMIIATDGRPVKPVSTKKVVLYPGERMDVVVRASKESGGYWMEASGTGACAGLRTKAMLLYSGFNYTSMLKEIQKDTSFETVSNSDAIYGQMLESLQDVSLKSDVRSVFLGIDKNIVKYNDTDIDFRYTMSDADGGTQRKPFFPAPLSIRDTGVVQINGKSFLYPSSPILLRRRNDQSDVTCILGEEDKIGDPQCVQILNAKEGEILELALVNEGFGSNDTYTFHMHGYGMQVVAMWENPNNMPISKEEFHRLDKEGKIKRNLKNPVIKDTVTVPNKGFTIVRVRIEHGGSWILECRSCSLYSLPAAILINVPQSIPKSVTDSLPKCGTYKPPDTLLN